MCRAAVAGEASAIDIAVADAAQELDLCRVAVWAFVVASGDDFVAEGDVAVGAVGVGSVAATENLLDVGILVHHNVGGTENLSTNVVAAEDAGLTQVTAFDTVAALHQY